MWGEKYIMIDQGLKGQKYLFPQFNQMNEQRSIDP